MKFSCLIFAFTLFFGCQTREYLLAPPEKGFVTTRKATKWEESLLTGNGTIGAMVIGDVKSERIILSHERLFMPQYPPYEAPDLGSRLPEIRKLILSGNNEEAADLMLEAGKEVGIDDMIWTDPLVPACQIELIMEEDAQVSAYNRGVDYETGVASVMWQSEKGQFRRDVFSSRADSVIVMRIYSPEGSKVNARLRLDQLPVDGAENDEDQEFAYDEVIESVSIDATKQRISYQTNFRKKWEGSLKGYVVETSIVPKGGEVSVDENWVDVSDAEELVLLTRINLSYELPVRTKTGVDRLAGDTYQELLERHSKIHSEMFNRYSISLGAEDATYLPPEELQATSKVGNLNPKLVEELCEAARYELISSTGALPPTLQGIWGGTWLPAWSGDFTLNGNVPTAISSGLNTNFQEVIEAYMGYMYSFRNDFQSNAKGLFGAPGIYVPSRTSSSGSTYHYASEYPHLFWFAGNAWTSQFFYDYWLYTGDDAYLKEKVIPFMIASMEFYEHILDQEEDGTYRFIPSYSPELGPKDTHPLAINATMDIAACKQLIRNLMRLHELGFISDTSRVSTWKEIEENLPEYAIDSSGDLKEWIWPGYENNNEHRHVSHLYPLFYEVDPDFKNNPELINAAKTAIENRLAYRRPRNGAEMAFGLAQIGTAAAHIGDTDHAYECVDYLCHTYWSPAFTSYHDPMQIFNVDISGGLPSLVTEMLIQSTASSIILLPTLPSKWGSGEIRGVLTRVGVEVDLVWLDGKVEQVELEASRDTEFTLQGLPTGSQHIRMHTGEKLTL